MEGLEEKLNFVGKSMITVLSPPFGLTLFQKKFKDKMKAFFIGAGISFISSVILLSPNNIYTPPEEISISKLPISPKRAAIESVVSPFLPLFNMDYFTSIQNHESSEFSTVRGRNVITFDGNKYNLNFNESSQFYFRGSLVSCMESEDMRITNAYQKIRGEYEKRVDKMNHELGILE